ncbi:hypothetical protein B0J11DRAFT_509301 [Dendryphion nanum]|uniref:Uncharacterized protein n=1 Tax=Dendryphion nanum TaxID=256645 RepID=A0A9P9IFL0_9PLEO|nr:hypothetical protein B0J11DRAFT_509301 [Dendryphion nanum]
MEFFDPATTIDESRYLARPWYLYEFFNGLVTGNLFAFLAAILLFGIPSLIVVAHARVHGGALKLKTIIATAYAHTVYDRVGVRLFNHLDEWTHFDVFAGLLTAALVFTAHNRLSPAWAEAKQELWEVITRVPRAAYRRYRFVTSVTDLVLAPLHTAILGPFVGAPVAFVYDRHIHSIVKGVVLFIYNPLALLTRLVVWLGYQLDPEFDVMLTEQPVDLAGPASPVATPQRSTDEEVSDVVSPKPDSPVEKVVVDPAPTTTPTSKKVVIFSPSPAPRTPQFAPDRSPLPRHSATSFRHRLRDDRYIQFVEQQAVYANTRVHYAQQATALMTESYRLLFQKFGSRISREDFKKDMLKRVFKSQRQFFGAYSLDVAPVAQKVPFPFRSSLDSSPSCPERNAFAVLEPTKTPVATLAEPVGDVPVVQESEEENYLFLVAKAAKKLAGKSEAQLPGALMTIMASKESRVEAFGKTRKEFMDDVRSPLLRGTDARPLGPVAVRPSIWKIKGSENASEQKTSSSTEGSGRLPIVAHNDISKILPSPEIALAQRVSPPQPLADGTSPPVGRSSTPRVQGEEIAKKAEESAILKTAVAEEDEKVRKDEEEAARRRVEHELALEAKAQAEAEEAERISVVERRRVADEAAAAEQAALAEAARLAAVQEEEAQRKVDEDEAAAVLKAASSDESPVVQVEVMEEEGCKAEPPKNIFDGKSFNFSGTSQLSFASGLDPLPPTSFAFSLANPFSGPSTTPFLSLAIPSLSLDIPSTSSSGPSTSLPAVSPSHPSTSLATLPSAEPAQSSSSGLISPPFAADRGAFVAGDHGEPSVPSASSSLLTLAPPSLESDAPGNANDDVDMAMDTGEVGRTAPAAEVVSQQLVPVVYPPPAPAAFLPPTTSAGSRLIPDSFLPPVVFSPSPSASLVFGTPSSGPVVPFGTVSSSVPAVTPADDSAMEDVATPPSAPAPTPLQAPSLEPSAAPTTPAVKPKSRMAARAAQTTTSPFLPAKPRRVAPAPSTPAPPVPEESPFGRHSAKMEDLNTFAKLLAYVSPVPASPPPQPAQEALKQPSFVGPPRAETPEPKHRLSAPEAVRIARTPTPPEVDSFEEFMAPVTYTGPARKLATPRARRMRGNVSVPPVPPPAVFSLPIAPVVRPVAPFLPLPPLEPLLATLEALPPLPTVVPPPAPPSSSEDEEDDDETEDWETEMARLLQESEAEWLAGRLRSAEAVNADSEISAPLPVDNNFEILDPADIDHELFPELYNDDAVPRSAPLVAVRSQPVLLEEEGFDEEALYENDEEYDEEEESEEE